MMSQHSGHTKLRPDFHVVSKIKSGNRYDDIIPTKSTLAKTFILSRKFSVDDLIYSAMHDMHLGQCLVSG